MININFQSFKMFKKKMNLETTLIIAVIFIAIGTFFLTYAPIRQAKIDQENVPESGKISKIISFNIKEPCISMGSANFIWAGEKGTPIISGRDDVTVWMQNSELQMSMIIRNKEGSIKTYINGNDWIVYPALISDRNFDPHAIEVIDKNGEVILQVQLVNNCIKLGFVMTYENGSKLQFGNNAMETVNENENFKNPIKPIFVYPSKGNFGKRAI